MRNFLFILLTFLSFNLFSQYCNLATTNVPITPTTTAQLTTSYNSGRRAFNFVATAGCTYVFETCGYSTSDTYLRLYSTGTGGTVLVTGDDNCGSQSRITWTCTTSGTYSILVTNWSCAVLSVATRVRFYISGCVTPFNPCSSISTLSCGVATTFTISSGNGLYNPPSTSCGFSTPGRERIFQITPTISGNYRISQPTSFGYIDWFYKLSSGGCTGSGWTCIDDISSGNIGNANVNIPLLAGQTYYIMGDPESTGGGSVTFTLNCPVSPPSNDLICNAITINCGTTLNGTTINSTNSGVGEGGSCGTSQTTGGVWYKVVGTGDLMMVSLCATFWDSKISVYQGTCTTPTCVGGVDDDGPSCVGSSSSYQWLSVLGTTYWVLVHGYSTTSSFSLSLTCSPPPTIGPCFATSPWTVLNMPTSPSTVSSTCLSGNGQFTDEYSTWNTGVAGTIYNVESSLSTDWVTVTVGSPSGTVVGYGATPISFTAPSNNTYYVHITTNGYCVGDANCRDVTVNRISSLPIELVSFNGMKKNGDNFLYWVTASERDNDYFTLEYSIDGEFWLDISNINAAGNSQQELSYSYIHKTYDRSVTNYYKLSQTDFNGVRTYFNDVAITNTPNQKEVVKIVNTVGQEVSSFSPNGMYFEIYDDGSIMKVMK
jgi:hypothetical protein